MEPMDETVDAEAIRIHRRKDERWMIMLDHYRYWLKPTKHCIKDTARYPSSSQESGGNTRSVLTATNWVIMGHGTIYSCGSNKNKKFCSEIIWHILNLVEIEVNRFHKAAGVLPSWWFTWRTPFPTVGNLVQLFKL